MGQNQREKRISKFCELSEVKQCEFHFLLQHSNYKDPQKELTDCIISNENNNLTLKNKVEKVKLLFQESI